MLVGGGGIKRVQLHDALRQELLLLPMLGRAGYPEQRGIGLVTSASALGVLLAPSVPLIMVAVIARVPIQDMLLAGLLPAGVMVACLLVFGGFLKRADIVPANAAPATPQAGRALAEVGAAAWRAKPREASGPHAA